LHVDSLPTQHPQYVCAGYDWDVDADAAALETPSLAAEVCIVAMLLDDRSGLELHQARAHHLGVKRVDDASRARHLREYRVGSRRIAGARNQRDRSPGSSNCQAVGPMILPGGTRFRDVDLLSYWRRVEGEWEFIRALHKGAAARESYSMRGKRSMESNRASVRCMLSGSDE